MPKPSVTTPLAAALRGVRRHLAFQQDELAARVGVSRRTVVRWEQGEGEPFVPERPRILAALGDVPYEILAPLAQALGLALARPPLSAEEKKRRELETKRALDTHLYAVAERADVSARRVREAVVAVLDKAKELGLSLDAARALVAAGIDARE